MPAILCFSLSVIMPFALGLFFKKRGAIKTSIVWGSLCALWMVLVGVLAARGMLSDFSGLPPRPFFVLFPALIAVISLSLSPAMGHVLTHTKPYELMGLQVFRLPVEIFLWLLFLQGHIPVQMTFEGYNWDILTGIAGGILFFLPQLARRKSVQWIFHGVGTLLLFNIVFIAITSMPTALRLFMNEPANRIVVTFPFIFLPTVLVPMALFLHLLGWRYLFLSRDV